MLSENEVQVLVEGGLNDDFMGRRVDWHRKGDHC
jgi:hypothetical protein